MGQQPGQTEGSALSCAARDDGARRATVHPAPPTRKQPQRRIATAREMLKLILPIAAIFIAYGLTLGTPNVYPVGYEMEYYPLFLLVMLGIYGAFLLVAVFVPPVRNRMLGWAYLIAATFLLIELFDLLTVKSGALLLPFAPSPDRILQALPNNLEAYATNLAASLVLLAEGVAIGLATGFATGLLMGWSRIANYWFAPLLKVIGPVPSAAWLPIAVVLMPTTHLAGVFLISVAIWFPLSLMLSSAIRSTDRRKIEAARTMGASEGYILFHVALPAAVPDMFTALFMGLSSSFGALIISEQLGVKAGLGWYINWASSWGEYYKVFAAVGLFIIIFYVLISLLFKVRDHVMKWQESVVRW